MPRCSACHQEGHNKRDGDCPLHEDNRRNVYAIRYRLIHKEFNLGGGNILVVALPGLYHHGLIVNGQEYGFGREGVTVIEAGTYYVNRNIRERNAQRNQREQAFSRIEDYTLLPPAYQGNVTERQVDNILDNLRREQHFVQGQYCVLHRNCVSFTQQMVEAILQRNGRHRPAGEWPVAIRQYPVNVVHNIIHQVNNALYQQGDAGHNGPHQCVMLS